eukprot:gene10441-7424_t
MAAPVPLPVSHTPKRALDQQFALVDDSSGAPSSVETGVNHARTLYSLAKSELSFKEKVHGRSVGVEQANHFQ